MHRLALPTLTAAVLLTACGTDGANGPNEPGPIGPQPVAVVSLDSPPDAIAVGQTVRLVAVAKSANGEVLAGRAISWASSRPAVAAIAANGELTALGEGTVIVTAASEGKSAQHTIRVSLQQRPIDRVVIQGGDAPVELRIGGTRVLTAQALDANGQVLGGKVVAWHSNNTDVVQISEAGIITAAFTGTAVVTARIDGLEDAVTVTVLPNVERVEITPAELLMVVGESTQMHANAYGEGNVVLNAGILWASSEPSVLTVDGNGRLTAHRPGVSVVSATAEGVQGRATVVVAGVTDFDLRQVNGSAPPAPMFQVQDQGGITRYEAQSGTFRLTGAGRYVQEFSMLVFAPGMPMVGGTFSSVGDVTHDLDTGDLVFTPDHPSMPPFVGVRVSATTLRVTQRFFANATEATVVYSVR